MSKSLFIATLEPRSGKSLVSLGVTELLSRRVGSLGFFRPVIPGGGGPDNDIELIRTRFGLPLDPDELHAFTLEEARRLIAAGRIDELLEGVFEAFKQLEKRVDFVVCEGIEFPALSAALGFDLNARLANHLGAPVVCLIRGKAKEPEVVVEQALAARGAFAAQGCSLVAAIVNRVDPARLREIERRLGERWSWPDPVFVLPEEPSLSRPTLGEIAEALGADPVFDLEEGRDREARHYAIGAAQLPRFLGNLREDSLILTPGDRGDLVLAALASSASGNGPSVAGIVLTGGMDLDPAVLRLIEGLRGRRVPILRVGTGILETSLALDALRAVIRPGSERKIASALRVFESGVDLRALERRIEVAPTVGMTPLMFQHELVEMAERSRKHIVLPEGTDERVLRAAEILTRRGAVEITLLGAESEVRRRIAELALDLADVPLIDPQRSPWREEFVADYHRRRADRGITEELAADLIADVGYFGTMMVDRGFADGMVSGAAHTTAQTVRPALQILRTAPGRSLVSSLFFMCLADRVLVFADCAVNQNPNAEQLAEIALTSAETAAAFGIEPRVAMLSYSTGESGSGDDVDRVRRATGIARAADAGLAIEGPMQYDAAVDPEVAALKLPGSAVAGRATVFVCPDLNTGNNTYKAVQRAAKAVAVGPVLQGLRRPVNDLSRGCSVTDIVNTVLITAIQAQQEETT
jgi:phosphate acetyltransferase